MTRLEHRTEQFALLTMSFTLILQYHEPANRGTIKAKAYLALRKGPSQTTVDYFCEHFQNNGKYVGIGNILNEPLCFFENILVFHEDVVQCFGIGEIGRASCRE